MGVVTNDALTSQWKEDMSGKSKICYMLTMRYERHPQNYAYKICKKESYANRIWE